MYCTFLSTKFITTFKYVFVVDLLFFVLLPTDPTDQIGSFVKIQIIIVTVAVCRNPCILRTYIVIK